MELSECSPIPVNESLRAKKLNESTSRLVSYVRSDIPVEVSVYEGDFSGLAIHTHQSSFGFL